MPSLSSISSSPTMREYAQGAAQDSIQPVADFLAPVVDVSTSVGKFKQYTERDRFRVLDTERSIGGRATVVAFDAADANYNCQPHALDYPVDILEQMEEEALEDRLKEGARACSEIAALNHEKTVIDAALAAAGAGTGKTWNSSADPVNDIDDAIMAVIKAAKYGSLMGVGVLFGATAWQIFKNQANVRGRYVVSSTKGGSGVGVAVPTMDHVGALFVGNPDVRASYMVYDSSAPGKDESISFLLDTGILIFARHSSPTRRDPSFMKTFRLRGKYMVPGTYEREDGRAQVAKFDWSEDVEVTNSTAVQRLNISAS